MSTIARRLPVGAEPAGRGFHFRVWAPRRRRVALRLNRGREEARVPLEYESRGYFSGHVPDARAGDRYGFLLDDEPEAFPDPASRFQPEGPEGPSVLVDPDAFAWTDAGWRGPQGPVAIYEAHVGTFTREGTWEAAAHRLPHLSELGVTAVEIMPVADFPGRFGWGYDGVSLFAPYRGYGPPDAFRSFVDAAHAHGLGVLLDVVYNHLGPAGGVLHAYAERYFGTRETEWGDAFDFGADEVREYFLANVRHWISEYRLDGLRLDATQSVFDDRPDHILGEIVREARDAAGGRRLVLVAENEPQDTALLRRHGYDHMWNDDLHHAAVVALTGRREAYYSDYRGTPQELCSAAKHGFLYQGQRYAWQARRRGTTTRDLPRSAFVSYLENHDQVANSARGRRLHDIAAPGAWRAMVAYVLLGPGTPLLFQGQEFASTSPFLYFADHRGGIATAVRRGRRDFLSQFPRLSRADARRSLPDPADPETWERSRLDWDGLRTEKAREAFALHRDLLRLRREDETLARQDACGFDGAVLGPQAFALRWLSDRGERSDRLLLVNLGADLDLSPVPEPLLAPPSSAGWKCMWSSEDPAYGGRGALPSEQESWLVPGQAAALLAPVEA